MSDKTDSLDGFVFAHGNVFERAKAIFGNTGWPYDAEITQRELAWIRREQDLYNEEIDRYCALKKKVARLQKKVGASLKLGPREFTLTYSPQWGWDDTEARHHMSIAIERLVRYNRNTIEELRAVGEVCKDGKSHVHCFYRLADGLKITDKNFTRAYPMWNTKVKCGKTGHQGGHHALVNDEASFKGYIEKDVETAWIDYLFSPE